MLSVAVLIALASIPTFVAPQAIDPKTVPIATRANWCQSQITSCPLLCSQMPGESDTVRANSCDPSTLLFQCVCFSGLSPNASEFSQTIPYYTCTEFNSQCVARCAGSSTCQSGCRENNPCGAKNPTRVNTSTITTMSSTASTASTQTGSSSSLSIATTFGGTLPTNSVNGQNSGPVAIDLGRSYGLALVAGGIFAGFALVM
jgi:hypothetical protein